MTFEEAMNYALTLSPAPSVRPARVDLASRRMAAVFFLSGTSHRNPLLHMEMTTKQIVPRDFFPDAHYAGHPTVLVRYDA